MDMVMEDMISMNENNNEYIDIVAMIESSLKSIRRLSKLIVVIMLIITAAYSGYKYMKYTPTYKTQVTFSVVKTTDPTFYYNVDATQQAKEVFTQILQSELLYSIVREDMNLSYLPGYYGCTAIEDTNLLVVSSYSNNANYSYQMIESMINNYDQVSQLVLNDVRLNVIGDYIRPVDPVNTFNWIKTILTGLCLSLALSIALIAIDVVLRKTIQKKDDVRKHLNTRCLAALPALTDKTFIKSSLVKPIIL